MEEVKRKHRRAKSLAEIDAEIKELNEQRKRRQEKNWIDEGRFTEELTGLQEPEAIKAALKTAWTFWQDHQQEGQENG